MEERTTLLFSDSTTIVADDISLRDRAVNAKHKLMVLVEDTINNLDS